MPDLTKHEIKELRKQLCDWHRPAEFAEIFDKASKRLGRTLLIQPGLEFLREAYLAAVFGRIRDASFVRLIDDPQPDAELRIGDTLERFEFTEADNPTRRRGQEYKKARRQAGEHDLVIEESGIEDWITEADAAPEALTRAAMKKKTKSYGKDNHLLIYLNINEFGIRHQEIKECFRESTESVGKNFRSIWILWGPTAYKVWDAGKPSCVRLTKDPME